MEFRWIDWNRDHIGEHGVHWEEAESVVRHVQPPFPEQIGDDKLLAVGKGHGGACCKLFTFSMGMARFS
jgi:hypothetical protein